jgi:hypothetical protein
MPRIWGRKNEVSPKHDAGVAVLLEILHVDLQAGREHDVEQAHRAEENKARIALQQVEPVGTDHHAGQDHADDAGHAQLAQQDGHQQDDEQHQRKHEYGVLEGKRKRYVQQHGVWSSGYWVLIIEYWVLLTGSSVFPTRAENLAGMRRQVRLRSAPAAGHANH